MTRNIAINSRKMYWRLNKQYILKTALLIAFIFMQQSTTPVSAQLVTLNKFYVITSNSNTHNTSIWEADATSSTSRRILTVNLINSTPASVLFSARELGALNRAISSGAVPQSFTTIGIIQSVVGTWLLDANRLLVETANEICRRDVEICFGYFEFLFADKTSGSLTSLTKVDYHNAVVDSWTGCLVDTGVQVDSVLPNPAQNKSVYSLTPDTSRQTHQEMSQVYIIDYSTLPVKIASIPLAGGISWSPDGTKMVYYSRESCQDTVCTTSVRVLAATPGAIPTVLTQSPLYYSTPIITAWMDNRTVMYQWLVSPTGEEGAFTFFWQDIIDNSKVEATPDRLFLPSSMFYLSQTQSHLLGLNTDNAAIGLPTQKTLTPITTFSPAYQVFYNSKFRSYLFLSQGNANQVLVIDSALNQSTLNLSNFITDPNEQIFFISPGDATTSPPTPAPGATPTPVPSTLKLQYYPDPDEAGTIGDAIGPDFNIVNTGSSSVPLSELKIRYYFTREGASALRFRCCHKVVDSSREADTGKNGNNATSAPIQPKRLSQQSPDIRLDFYSPRGFSIISNVYALWMGNKKFVGESRLTGDIDKVSFFLTPAEFASVNNGDDVVIGFHPAGGNLTAPPDVLAFAGSAAWFFGPLDKTKLRVDENLRITKQRTVGVLTTVRAQLTNPQDITNLDNAIQQINNATAPALWQDGLRLQSASGASVFNSDLSAINSLQQITNTAVIRELNVVKNVLAFADATLAGFALSGAEKAGGDPALLAQAGTALDQGWTALNAIPTQPANAITPYRDAWQYAKNAIPATPTPTPSSSTNVEIRLFVPGGIPIQNSVPMLIIGNKKFVGGLGIGPIVFHLTPAEFASVNNGDQVVLLYDRVYVFGPLDKNNLNMNEQLKAEKQGALDSLVHLRTGVTDPQDASRLDAAIQQLTDSLASGRWIDALHLDPSQGLAVFNAEMNAVAGLQLVTNADLARDLSNVIYDLVKVDQGLAGLALGEARTAGGTQSLIDQGETALKQAYAAIQSQSYTSAITSYRDAWQYAKNAIAATPTPTPSATPTPVPSTLKLQYYPDPDEAGTIGDAIGPATHTIPLLK